MKNIFNIYILVVFINLILIGCNNDPLGIEKNVLITPLDSIHKDTTIKQQPKPAIIDSIYTCINEKLIYMPTDKVDRNYNWKPKINNLVATLDTSIVPHRLWLNLTMEIPVDTIKDRHEKVKYVHLRMDSVLTTGSYDLFNSDYFRGWSLMYVQYQSGYNNYEVELSGQDSPLKIEFIENQYDNNRGWVKAQLTADIRAMDSMHKLLFTGWFKIFYKL